MEPTSQRQVTFRAPPCWGSTTWSPFASESTWTLLHPVVPGANHETSEPSCVNAEIVPLTGPYTVSGCVPPETAWTSAAATPTAAASSERMPRTVALSC